MSESVILGLPVGVSFCLSCPTPMCYFLFYYILLLTLVNNKGLFPKETEAGRSGEEGG